MYVCVCVHVCVCVCVCVSVCPPDVGSPSVSSMRREAEPPRFCPFSSSAPFNTAALMSVAEKRDGNDVTQTHTITGGSMGVPPGQAIELRSTEVRY